MLFERYNNIWEVVFWEMLFETYKLIPLRDCFLRDVDFETCYLPISASLIENWLGFQLNLNISIWKMIGSGYNINQTWINIVEGCCKYGRSFTWTWTAIMKVWFKTGLKLQLNLSMISGSSIEVWLNFQLNLYMCSGSLVEVWLKFQPNFHPE